MNRKEELTKIFDSVDDNIKKIIFPMIDDVVFLEIQLNELKKLPFIEVHPNNSMLQRPTPAAKQYKELLQQYNNCVKILCSVIRKTAGDEPDPVAEFLEAIKNGT